MTTLLTQAVAAIEQLPADVQDAIAIDSSLSQSVLEAEIEMELASPLNDSEGILPRLHSFVIGDVGNPIVTHDKHVRVRRHSSHAGGHAQYDEVAFRNPIHALQVRIDGSRRRDFNLLGTEPNVTNATVVAAPHDENRAKSRSNPQQLGVGNRRRGPDGP